MNLGLLGFPIRHSLSPKLYQELLGSNVNYDLLEYSDPFLVPTISELSKKYNGLNITTPYKHHFTNVVEYEIEAFAELGLINTLSFIGEKAIATNTDYAAVEIILSRYRQNYPKLKILLLGSGAMAKITELIASTLDIPLVEISRRYNFDLKTIDLNLYRDQNAQILVINATSRNFLFTGKLSLDFLFWDYNYSYLSDSAYISRQVKEYQDGQEMLRLQAPL